MNADAHHGIQKPDSPPPHIQQERLWWALLHPMCGGGFFFEQGGYTAWIESHDTLWEHHKTIRLCALLQIGRAQAVGHLHGLWHFVLRNAWRDANLEAWGDDEIERGAWWEGEKGVFVRALRETGFLDGFVVHDWLERAGRLVGDRRYNELRRKTSVKCTSKRRKSLATLPYPTLPYPTLPNHTGDARNFQEPSIEEIAGYCHERRNRIDPAKFHAFYSAKGWMIGKNKMKDWRAAVRTWEKNDFNIPRQETEREEISRRLRKTEEMIARRHSNPD